MQQEATSVTMCATRSSRLLVMPCLSRRAVHLQPCRLQPPAGSTVTEQPARQLQRRLNATEDRARLQHQRPPCRQQRRERARRAHPAAAAEPDLLYAAALLWLRGRRTRSKRGGGGAAVPAAVRLVAPRQRAAGVVCKLDRAAAQAAGAGMLAGCSCCCCHKGLDGRCTSGMPGGVCEGSMGAAAAAGLLASAPQLPARSHRATQCWQQPAKLAAPTCRPAARRAGPAASDGPCRRRRCAPGWCGACAAGGHRQQARTVAQQQRKQAVLLCMQVQATCAGPNSWHASSHPPL